MKTKKKRVDLNVYLSGDYDAVESAKKKIEEICDNTGPGLTMAGVEQKDYSVWERDDVTGEEKGIGGIAILVEHYNKLQEERKRSANNNK